MTCQNITIHKFSTYAAKDKARSAKIMTKPQENGVRMRFSVLVMKETLRYNPILNIISKIAHNITPVLRLAQLQQQFCK